MVAEKAQAERDDLRAKLAAAEASAQAWHDQGERESEERDAALARVSELEAELVREEEVSRQNIQDAIAKENARSGAYHLDAALARVRELEEEAEEHYQEGYTDGQHDSADVARIAALEGALKRCLYAMAAVRIDILGKAPCDDIGEFDAADEHARRVLEGRNE